jgi:hypothetical protein
MRRNEAQEPLSGHPKHHISPPGEFCGLFVHFELNKPL